MGLRSPKILRFPLVINLIKNVIMKNPTSPCLYSYSCTYICHLVHLHRPAGWKVMMLSAGHVGKIFGTSPKSVKMVEMEMPSIYSPWHIEGTPISSMAMNQTLWNRKVWEITGKWLQKGSKPGAERWKCATWVLTSDLRGSLIELPQSTQIVTVASR